MSTLFGVDRNKYQHNKISIKGNCDVVLWGILKAIKGQHEMELKNKE